MYPHSDAELIKAKIKKENLLLLPEKDRDYICDLQKMLDWQEGYSFIEWEEFKNWIYCDRCKGYNDDQCICWSR